MRLLDNILLLSCHLLILPASLATFLAQVIVADVSLLSLLWFAVPLVSQMLSLAFQFNAAQTRLRVDTQEIITLHLSLAGKVMLCICIDETLQRKLQRHTTKDAVADRCVLTGCSSTNVCLWCSSRCAVERTNINLVRCLKTVWFAYFILISFNLVWKIRCCCWIVMRMLSMYSHRPIRAPIKMCSRGVH